jgi:ferric enterobactin receptor
LKKCILAGLLICICYATHSQTIEKTNAKAKIIGNVTDSSTGLPLEYATITLIKHSESKARNGATTDSLGNFVVTDVRPGTFRIVVEFIDYSPFIINNVIVQKHEVVDLKTIWLLKKQQTLQNLEVTAEKKLVENRIDKLVYNAEKDITSQTGVATDILKKVPQVGCQRISASRGPGN